MSGKLELVSRPTTPNWYFRGTDNEGKRVFRSTGTSDKALAEELLTQANARLQVERVHGREATITFREAAKAYMNDGGERQYLARELASGEVVGLIPYFGADKMLRQITQADLDAAAHAICPDGSRETLIRNVYTPFIAVWNYAAKSSRKWVQPVQWVRPRKPKGTAVRQTETRSGTKPVPYERAWEFVSAMSPAPAMVMTTLFYTGMRPIELFALECSDVDVDGRWITVQASKTGPGRGVPMHELLVPLLSILSKRGGRLFLTRHGKPYPITDEFNHGQLKGAILGARERLRKAKRPIDDVSPYTARHTVSTQLVINGVHPHVKDQILGHAADDMSRHYTNVPQAPLIDAINTLPIIAAWRDAKWLNDPLVWQHKLLRWENHGRRGKPKEETQNAQEAA